MTYICHICKIQKNYKHKDHHVMMWMIHINTVSHPAGIMEIRRRWVLGIWNPSLKMVSPSNTPTVQCAHIQTLSFFTNSNITPNNFNILQSWWLFALCSHVPRRVGHKRPADRRRTEGAAVRPTGRGMGLPQTRRRVRTHHQSHRPALHARYDITKPLWK